MNPGIDIDNISFRLIDKRKGIEIETADSNSEIHLPFGSSRRITGDVITSVLIEPYIGIIRLGTSSSNDRGFIFDYAIGNVDGNIQFELDNIYSLSHCVHDMINVLRGYAGGGGQMLVVGPNSGKARMSYITPYADNETKNVGRFEMSSWENNLRFDVKESIVELVQLSDVEVKRDDISGLMRSMEMSPETSYRMLDNYRHLSKMDLK